MSFRNFIGDLVTQASNTIQENIQENITDCIETSPQKCIESTIRAFEEYAIKNYKYKKHINRKQFYINVIKGFNNKIKQQNEIARSIISIDPYDYFLEIYFFFFEENACISNDGDIVSSKIDKIKNELNRLVRGNSYEVITKIFGMPKYIYINLVFNTYSPCKVNIIKQWNGHELQ